MPRPQTRTIPTRTIPDYRPPPPKGHRALADLFRRNAGSIVAVKIRGWATAFHEDGDPKRERSFTYSQAREEVKRLRAAGKVVRLEYGHGRRVIGAWYDFKVAPGGLWVEGVLYVKAWQNFADFNAMSRSLDLLMSGEPVGLSVCYTHGGRNHGPDGRASLRLQEISLCSHALADMHPRDDGDRLDYSGQLQTARVTAVEALDRCALAALHRARPALLVP